MEGLLWVTTATLIKVVRADVLGCSIPQQRCRYETAELVGTSIHRQIPKLKMGTVANSITFPRTLVRRRFCEDVSTAGSFSL